MTALVLLAAACTAEEADSAAPGGGPSAVAWPCGLYSPQTVLRRPPGEVSYRSTFDLESVAMGTGTITFEGLGTATLDRLETWVHRATGDTLDTAGTAHHWVTTTWYVCDALGLQQHHVTESQTRTDPEGHTTDASADRVYSTMPLVYPLDLALGSSWTFHQVFHETRSDGSAVDVDQAFERSAATEEEVTVPAGTFSALHIVVTDTEGGTTNLYTAPEVGTVRDDEMVLTAHEELGP